MQSIIHYSNYVTDIFVHMGLQSGGWPALFQVYSILQGRGLVLVFIGDYAMDVTVQGGLDIRGRPALSQAQLLPMMVSMLRRRAS